MQKSTLIAIAVAPILGPLLWWLYKLPGKLVATALWKRLPEGRLRRVLLRKVG